MVFKVARLIRSGLDCIAYEFSLKMLSISAHLFRREYDYI